MATLRASMMPSWRSEEMPRPLTAPARPYAAPRLRCKRGEASGLWCEEEGRRGDGQAVCCFPQAVGRAEPQTDTGSSAAVLGPTPSRVTFRLATRQPQHDLPWAPSCHDGARTKLDNACPPVAALGALEARSPTTPHTTAITDAQKFLLFMLRDKIQPTCRHTWRP